MNPLLILTSDVEPGHIDAGATPALILSYYSLPARRRSKPVEGELRHGRPTMRVRKTRAICCKAAVAPAVGTRAAAMRFYGSVKDKRAIDAG
jgi:hypothetical protein